jgi:hypothetical protein
MLNSIMHFSLACQGAKLRLSSVIMPNKTVARFNGIRADVIDGKVGAAAKVFSDPPTQVRSSGDCP